MKSFDQCPISDCVTAATYRSLVCRSVTLLSLLFLPVVVFCQVTEQPESDHGVTNSLTQKFDKELWRIKEGPDYPYRDQMLEDVVYNDTIRSLTKEQLVGLLGNPDRTNQEYLYYRIKERRLWFWVLHAKTMVIKLTDSNDVDWIKIHE